MTPQEFVNKWANPPLRERQIAQMHFLDVCLLVGVEMPAAGKTEAGEDFAFEPSLKLRHGHGFADVYYENHFAIEYKTADKYKDLNAAYDQLLKYRENLNNPPLLVVTDFNHWEIHSNFPNTAKRVYRFSHGEIASSSETWEWLRALFHAPERLHPGRNTEQVTKEAADA
ncbi:MAG: class I SAM-dependent DNA methyltransferase, partial [Chloroflexi bacterium]|nr:class I SAM-dependent DNA methyltransferase [Chloroflexota bacterium]